MECCNEREVLERLIGAWGEYGDLDESSMDQMSEIV